MGETTSPAKAGTRAEEVRRERRRKKPEGVIAGQRLAVDLNQLDDENYAYRWVNDKGSRVQQMTADDWDPAPEVNGGTESRVVGTDDGGRSMNALLMRKPKDWFDADKEEKAAKLRALDEQMRRGAHKTKDDEPDTAAAQSYTPGTGKNTIRTNYAP